MAKIIKILIPGLLIASVGFIWLVFTSDSLLDVGDVATSHVKHTSNHISSTTVITVVEEEIVHDTESGHTTTPPGAVVPGITPPQPPPDNITLNPVTGDAFEFPKIGEAVKFKEINKYSNSGELPRYGSDLLTWEFPYDYIIGRGQYEFPTMSKRASTISRYIVDPESDDRDALVVELAGKRFYVGCLPISTFGKVGDIIEFEFNEGGSIQVLTIDAKAAEDSEGSGFPSQVNTEYCHGTLVTKDGVQTHVKLSAIELWCIGDKSSGKKFPTITDGKTVKSVKVIYEGVITY